MAAPSTPVRLFDIYAPGRDGVYDSVFSQNQADIQSYVENDQIKLRIGLIARAATTTQRIYDYVNPSGATVELAIGQIDSTPTGGTFQLSYAADTTGLTALAYNISAATLQTALNANPGISGGGATVTVTAVATAVYRIAWDQVGVRSLLAADGANLTPGSTVTASRVVTGTASVKEVQIVRLLQRPYAYNATWSAFPVAAAAVTQLQTGTSSLPSIQRVSLDPEPFDGSCVVTFGKANVVRVLCKANTGAVAEVSTVQTVADSGGSLSGLYFTIYDNVGPVRVWLDVSSGSTAPGVPAGGRLLEVNIATNDSAATIATAIQTALDADSKFAATVSSNLVVVTDSNTGTRTDIAAGTSTFTVAVTTQGTGSALDDKYFTIYDDTDDSVAVWLTTDSTTPPSGVTGADRYLTVAIGAADSANTIGTAIAAVIDADPDFTCTNSSGILTITNATNGVRTAATANDSTFGVSVTSGGITLSPVILWNAEALDIQKSIDPNSETIIVTKSGPFSWDFKFVENGSRSALAADVTGLKVPLGLIGTLSLNTEQMLAAAAAAGGEPFDALFEGSVTFSGEGPWTFYRQTITIYPDMIDFSTLAPANLPSYANLAGNNTFTGTNTFEDNVTIDGTLGTSVEAEFGGGFVSDGVANFASAIMLNRTATATNYVVLTSDCIIGVTSTAAARDVTLPAAASHARKIFIVKDESGGAAANNITVKAASGTLDGVAAATGVAIATNYGVSRWYSNGTNWFSF